MFQLHDHGETLMEKLFLGEILVDNLQHFCSQVLKTMKKQEQATKLQVSTMKDCSIEQLSLPPKPDIGGDHFDVYQNYEISATYEVASKSFKKRRV